MIDLGHHWRVIRAALRDDAARRRAQPALESAFLPARLEVLERPVSPTGRITARVLIAGLAVTLAWLVLGRVDTVASAPGTVLASGRTRVVQAADMGVVAAIHVRDGDRVRRGEVLVEFDTTLANAALQQARDALLGDRLEIERNRALVAALDGHGIAFHAPPGTPADVAAAQRDLIAAQLAESDATVAGYTAARSSAAADAAAAAATRSKLDATLPILDHEVEAMQRLDAKGYAPGLRLLELQRQRRSDAGDRDVAAAQESRGAAEARRAAAEGHAARETARRTAMADLARAAADAIVRQEDVTKAARRASLDRLIAPIDGTVQQLAVHTIGGVVEPARPVLAIVPGDGDVEVEAHVLNRDIGFVHEGQAAAVKVAAFPFTRYGSIVGTVVSLSRDAVPDPHLGAAYVARIRLARGTIVADGQTVALTPGLSVTADIRTGSRRIIWWLLSPILTTVAQAGHEH